MPARVLRATAWLRRPTPADLPWYVLAFQTVIAVAVSPLPRRSLVAVVPHAVGLVAYWVVARLPGSERALRGAVAGLAALTIGLSVGGLAALLGGRVSPALPNWAGSMFVRVARAFNPNVLAGYLALLVPVQAGVLMPAKGARTSLFGMSPLRGMSAVALALGVTALAATGSRAGMVAATIGIVALAAWRWPRALIGVTVLAGSLLCWNASRTGWTALGESLTAGAGTTAGLPERVEIWQRALYIVQDFSFTGLGFGCFEPVAEVMYPLFLSQRGTQPHAHNLLLQVAVDLGVPGLVAYLAWQGLTVGILLRAARLGSDWRGLAAGLAAGTLSMQAHGILDAAVWGNSAAMIPWVVAALAVPLYEQNTSPDSVNGMPDE